LALLEPSKQHWLHEAVRGSKTCEDSWLPFGQEEHPALQHIFCELRENTRTRTMLYKNATQRLIIRYFFSKKKREPSGTSEIQTITGKTKNSHA